MLRLQNIFWVTLCVAIMLLSCTPSNKQASSKPLIAVTIAPTASLIRSLAGDSVDVLTLLPEGTTPESYEPTMETLKQLSRADAWCYIGDLGFETTWAHRVKELNPDLMLIRLDSGLKHIYNGHVHADGSVHLLDPHYWMSITGIEVMLRNLVLALKDLHPSLDTSQAEVELLKKLEKLRDKAQNTSNTSASSFLIYHPSLTYLAEELGLEQLVIEQHGKEPTVPQLRGVIERVRQTGTRVMFFQREFGVNARSIDYIEGEVPLRRVLINPFSPDWYSELELILEALAEPSQTT